MAPLDPCEGREGLEERTALCAFFAAGDEAA